jgi:hypothetical protein
MSQGSRREGRLPFSEAGLQYLRDHAIDPDVAVRRGLREESGWLVFPACDAQGLPAVRRRSLNGGPKFLGERGVSLGVWLVRRPEQPWIALLCEGGGDGLAADSALEAGNEFVQEMNFAVGAVPGTGCPVERIVDAARDLGAIEYAVGFDGDAPGRAAAVKAVDALRAAGFRAYPVDLPDGTDLADCLAREVDPSYWLASLIMESSAAEDQRQAEAALNDEQCAHPEARRLRFVSGAELRSVVPDEPDWVLDGYIARGSLVLVAGKPKVGKSTF